MVLQKYKKWKLFSDYCQSGYEKDTNAQCNPCQRGYYKDNNMDVFSDCTLCPVTHITSGTASTSQNDCNIGMYNLGNVLLKNFLPESGFVICYSSKILQFY